MTESDWATSIDPQAMLAVLRDRGPVSDRKADLFDAACCQRLGDLLYDDVLRRAVGIVEDGRKQSLGDQEYEDFRDELERLVYAVPPPDDPTGMARSGAALTASSAFHSFGMYRPTANFAVSALVAAGHPQGAAQSAQADLVRDLFGNPFRPISFLPEWRTEAVVALARGIYEERLYERMPVLGDALEEAGCTAPDVLEHCRGPTPHVRGCWVVDLVLGKT